MHILRHRHYLRTQNKIQQQQQKNETKQNKTKPNESMTKTRLGTETATEKSGQQCHENFFS